MISGLLKLMRRLSLARHHSEFWVPFEIHCSIDRGLVSTELACARYRLVRLPLCNGHTGAEGRPAAVTSQIVQ